MEHIEKRKHGHYGFVIAQLTSRELKRKYARSYLGVVWSVLNPLLSMAVLSLIFSRLVPAFHRQLSHLLSDGVYPMADLYRSNDRRNDHAG